MSRTVALQPAMFVHEPSDSLRCPAGSAAQQLRQKVELTSGVARGRAATAHGENIFPPAPRQWYRATLSREPRDRAATAITVK